MLTSSVVATALLLVSVLFPGQPPAASHTAASSREYFNHRQSDLESGGLLPVERTFDHGFPNRVALHLVEQKHEPHAVTSKIFDDKDAGFVRSGEVLVGSHYYWFDSRNVRTNVQVMHMDRSPATSFYF
jgi:hypothetical protein